MSNRRKAYIAGMIVCALLLIGLIVGRVIWERSQAVTIEEPNRDLPVAAPAAPAPAPEAPPPAAEPEPEPEPEPEEPEIDLELLAEVKTDYGYDLNSFDDRFDHFGTLFLDTSMTWMDQARAAKTGLKTGAFDYPLEEKPIEDFADEENPEWAQRHDLLEQTEERIMLNPVYGAAVNEAVMRMEVKGIKMPLINEWTTEFHDWYEEQFALGGVSAFLTAVDENGNSQIDKEELRVSPEYRYYAKGLCAILEMAANEGIREGMKSTTNWILNLSPDTNLRHHMENEAQEDKPCLLLYFGDDKTNQRWSQVGFNQLDGRPELFDKEDRPADPPPKDPSPPAPKPPAPAPIPDPPAPDPLPTPSSAGGTSLPQPTSSGGNPAKPAPAPDPEPAPNPDPPPHKPDGEGGKDPNEDPVNKGNAPIGGGKNDDPGPGPYEPANTVNRPDGSTIVLLPNGDKTTADEMNNPNGNPADPKNDDGHEVSKVDGSETPPKVETPITQDPDVGGSFGDTSKGDTPVENGNGKGEGATKPDPVVTESVEDPF